VGLKHVKESLFVIQRTVGKVGPGQGIITPGFVPTAIVVIGGYLLGISPKGSAMATDYYYNTFR